MTDPHHGSPAPVDSGALLQRGLVPYITTWSTEETLPTTVIAAHRRPGIAYADETLDDRDEHGILWLRTPSSPGRGRPLFGKVHPLPGSSATSHPCPAPCPISRSCSARDRLPDYLSRPSS
jgi:hypothetical protein